MGKLTNAVTIGRVLKPFGVKGEVQVESLTDVPGRFENLPTVTLVDRTGKTFNTAVTQARASGTKYLLKFSAFSSPEEAAAFRGALVQVPEDSVPPSPENQYYQFELIGLSVQDLNGKNLGALEEIMNLPQHPVFVVRQDEEEYLIPATHHIVTHVDLKAKLMTVAPIEEWGIAYAV